MARGEKILCIVPESGRALVGFMMLEAVVMDDATPPVDPAQEAELAQVLRKLTVVWAASRLASKRRR